MKKSSQPEKQSFAEGIDKNDEEVSARFQILDYKKVIVENKEFFGKVRNEDFSKREFVRVFAVNVIFVDVKFNQCEFSRCYFRNCRLIRCDFTGSNIKESNFRGSQFEECKFLYTTWEKTYLDERFLNTCLPSEDNLARDLVRSLRVNFSQIGNYEAVNKAASIEVSLTGQHLFKAAYSRESYYRGKEKYNGWSRLVYIYEHLLWKVLDLLWGNGESIFRVAISALTIIILSAIFLMWEQSGVRFMDASRAAFFHFWGIQGGFNIPDYYIVFLTIMRFFYLDFLWLF